MIAVDTSALMAILLDEPKADDCMVAIQEADRLLISAGTMAKALIVAGHRNLGDAMAELIDGLDYGRWGKGIHPATLNFGSMSGAPSRRPMSCLFCRPIGRMCDWNVRTDQAPRPESRLGEHAEVGYPPEAG